ncbi:hypothetical protein GMST_02660 [Geomonas silvestris]|uniref:Methyltransferase n=1 Tax=Geomonas silvestris TaxID=2740184 RepID=A0A6V8MD66_9BACT|nr:class I SAM-dependent methyltransferase [Geomonas silvestris]GFO57941.1 hypothetical protein GMST_02660 [Geomonas silvestris]
MTSFDARYYEFNGQDADRPALWFYTRLARVVFRPGPVLDFGCGTGYFLKRLSRYFPAEGLEVSEHGLARCRELVPQAPLYRSLEELPSGHYRGITALHVLEHIPDVQLEEVLGQWRRALTSDGQVLCVMPELEGRGHRLKGEGWCGFADPSHINLKRRGEWQEFFSRNGFELLQIGTDGLWDFPYTPNRPRRLDLILRGAPTVLQFLAGRMLLAPGSGESLIGILRVRG